MSDTMDNLIKRAQARLDEFRALPPEEKKRVALEHLISIGVLLPDGSENPEFYPPVYQENDKLHKFQQGTPCPKTNKPN